MEAFLKTCEVEDLASAFADLGTESVGDIAICETDDLVSDLNMDPEKAAAIIQKAKDAMLFERRKYAVQGSWKAVEDALAVDATKLFYSRLFEQFPSVKPLFENTDMDAQAEKLYKTVSLATQYLDDVDSLIPVLEEMGARVSNAGVEKICTSTKRSFAVSNSFPFCRCCCLFSTPKSINVNLSIAI